MARHHKGHHKGHSKKHGGKRMSKGGFTMSQEVCEFLEHYKELKQIEDPKTRLVSAKLSGFHLNPITDRWLKGFDVGLPLPLQQVRRETDGMGFERLARVQQANGD